MTHALIYDITKTPQAILNDQIDWSFHKTRPLGFAYEAESHFVHFWGGQSRLWFIGFGFAAAEKKHGTLTEWVEHNFGGTPKSQTSLPVGTSVRAVWRPGLYYENQSQSALKFTSLDRHAAEQNLRLLVGRLDEILLYIEPSDHGLSTYSHKTRELLLLACTEVEASLVRYLSELGVKPEGSMYSTSDYVKLKTPLHLEEFEIAFSTSPKATKIIPFGGWSANAATQTLRWYDAYNKTKHNRNQYFNAATLEACFYAVAANIVLHCVRFGPYRLFEDPSVLSSLVNQHCEISLVQPQISSFYVPRLRLDSNQFSQISAINGIKFMEPWNIIVPDVKPAIERRKRRRGTRP